MRYSKKFTEWLIENVGSFSCCEGKRGWQAQVGVSTPIRSHGEPTKAAALIELFRLLEGQKGNSELLVVRKNGDSVSVEIFPGDRIELDGEEVS